MGRKSCHNLSAPFVLVQPCHIYDMKTFKPPHLDYLNERLCDLYWEGKMHKQACKKQCSKYIMAGSHARFLCDAIETIYIICSEEKVDYQYANTYVLLLALAQQSNGKNID